MITRHKDGSATVRHSAVHDDRRVTITYDLPREQAQHAEALLAFLDQSVISGHVAEADRQGKFGD